MVEHGQNGHMLTDDEVAELAALRARAYGPDADLTDDPGGLERLNELENRARNPFPDADPLRSPAREVSAVPPPADPVAPSVHMPAQPAAGMTALPARAPSAESRPRRTWSRRAVLLVGIPMVVVAGAVGVGIGAVAASQSAGPAPAPSTTLAAGYVASLRSVTEMHTWDPGSPRLLADLSGTLVWDGTTASGSVTCVVVDDASQQPLSACEATDALTTGGVGVSVADPRTNATRTYVAWPHGAPKVTYSSDDPNPSP